MAIVKNSKLTKDELSELSKSIVGIIEKDQELSLRITKVIIAALAADPGLGSLLVDSLEDQFPQSVLSEDEIKKGIKNGYIIIDPFKVDRLKTSSYDISLGQYYWTTQTAHPGSRVFNPHNPKHVKKLWEGPYKAKTVRAYLKDPKFKEYIQEKDFEGLKLDDPIIIVAPGETILAHTEEYIGGKNKVTMMMKARSSWGRAFLSVCKDAGWGDVGYFNRWTMEIQNNLQHAWSIVPVGQPIAQMIFFRVNPIMSNEYHLSGNYQDVSTLKDLKKKWNPEMMLPKLTRKTSIFDLK